VKEKANLVDSYLQSLGYFKANERELSYLRRADVYCEASSGTD